MAAIHSDEFKRDAVRIALTSGLTRRQVASDLGIGLSTLGKWVRAVSEEAKVPAQDAELLRENERLRKENRILREEREVLKKAAMFFGLVTVWCRSFGHVMCSKGEELWAQEEQTNFARMRCGSR